MVRFQVYEKLFVPIPIFFSDHTKVTYIINCPNVSEYNLSELEKLRSILEVFTKGQYDDIIVAGVKTGCVIVTLMIRNCLIPKLRKLYTSEKGSMTCQWMLKLPLKYKLMKVMIQDDLIYMSGMSFSLTLSFHISEWSNIASLAHWILFSLLNT